MWQPQGIYADFVLYQPTVFFGDNAIKGLSTFPGSRIAVISSSSLYDSVRELLFTVFKKKSLRFINRSWHGEPDMESIAGSISELESFKPDVIIAIGGGSVIDGAKLCRLFYEFPYFKVGETKVSQLLFKTKFIAVPTTVGSGAEASSAAVYINKAEERKEMIVSHELQPSVVILNPEYVATASERIIVSSALDAIGHITEGYISVRNNEITDIYAEKALSILVEELPKKDRDYQRIQYAGYLGGIVQNHCIVGAAHAIAHQLSEYGYTHSEAVALLLPHVIRTNIEKNGVLCRVRQLCKNSNIDNENVLIEFIEDEVQTAGINDRKVELYQVLNELLKDDHFIENVMYDMSGKGNPVPITKEYIEKVIGGIGNGF